MEPKHDLDYQKLQCRHRATTGCTRTAVLSRRARALDAPATRPGSTRGSAQVNIDCAWDGKQDRPQRARPQEHALPQGRSCGTRMPSAAFPGTTNKMESFRGCGGEEPMRNHQCRKCSDKSPPMRSYRWLRERFLPSEAVCTL